MPNRQPGKWIVAAAGLLGALIAAPRANACVTGEMAAVAGAAALLTPGDLGAAVPAADTSPTRFVMSWSWQLPVAGIDDDHIPRHRVVPEVNLLPHSGGVSWRGRLGYRYGRRHMFAGAGVGIDGAGLNLSPEIGVKFLHSDMGDKEFDASMHLLARAEIAPDSGQVRGGTVLLGWNLF
jgi:hypothetical protein